MCTQTYYMHRLYTKYIVFIAKMKKCAENMRFAACGTKKSTMNGYGCSF